MIGSLNPNHAGGSEKMNYRLVLSKARTAGFLIRKAPLALAVLTATGISIFAQTQDAAAKPAPGENATLILGLKGISHNANGKLSVADNALQFQKTGGAKAQVELSSIQDAFLGSESKQVGGVPLTLGRAAVPFGGGRAIALFSHKLYDTLTVEYLDADGGLHGAIFQMNKGQAQAIKDQLAAAGAHVSQEGQTAAAAAPEVKK
jgi:hypothetical protein